MYNKYYIRRSLWAILLTTSVALAGGPEYFGLTINVNSKSDVIKTLKSRNATYNDNYGYKGYSKTLAVIKVINDPLLNTHGVIKDAWLEFTPDDKLYRINVDWRDAGKTYLIIKDVFDDKYQHQQNTSRGFVTKHIYHNGDTRITLTRNAFGFRDRQITSVEYLYTPAMKDVDAMKRKINSDIKQKNIKHKGKNF